MVAYPMVGGDGDYSYAKNSFYQRMVVDAAKEMIDEVIANKLDFKSLGFDASKTFQLVDLGCSTGPNTFIAVQNIIEAVERKYKAGQKNSPSLEFQVFFNDHCGNDFNVLFKTLPPSRKYIAAGVPGSFHDRLLPKSTLHFAYSSYAMHWLSKVPEEVVDVKSPAWNKGSILCSGLVKAVVEAYSAQFRNEMESFLNARAQELIPGGLMVIVLSVNDIPMFQTTEGKVFNVLFSCLTDMAKMGLINEEKVDSFNLPLYYPTTEELQAVIQRNGFFITERMDKLNDPPMIHNYKFSAQDTSSQLRSCFEGTIKQHFGNDLVDQIFNCLTPKLAENSFIFDEKDHKKVNLFVLLKRTIN